MSLLLNLPSELAGDLSAEAQRLGLTLPEYVLCLLAKTRPERPRLKNGGDLLRYWQAERLIGTRTDISDSQQHARELRQQAQARH